MFQFNNTLKAGILGSALLALSGCATPIESQPPLHLKNPIQISESIERLELYSRPNGMSLSARDSEAVAIFLDGYNRFGDGPIYMNYPTHSNAGVMQTRNVVQTIMGQIGMGRAAIQEGQYQSMPHAPAPVIVSYRRLKTLPRDCSIRSNLTRTYSNQPWKEFGCVQNANLAAMVQDYRQLLAPYEQTAPDMRRRMTVYDKYIKGESPASQLPPNQSMSSTEEQ